MDLQTTLVRSNQAHQEEEKDKEMSMESTEVSVSAAPPMPGGLTRQTSSGGSKTNCLCSPTTHAGSFRCRLHRAPSGLQRAKSVESSSMLLRDLPPKVTDGNTVETSS